MKLQDVKKIGIAGAGTMGSGIAQIFAAKGCKVVVTDLGETDFEKSRRLVGLFNANLVEEGLLTEDATKNILDNISYSTDKNVFSDADVIIEAIIEKMEIKQAFWKEVEQIARNNAFFATNTSGLSINEMCSKMKNKKRFIGMHFWNPPHIIPLVELIRADGTADETVDELKELVYAIDKEPVIVQKDAPGFIGNRLQFAVFREALHIVEEGIAGVDDVDRAMRYGPGFRYPVIGPFQTADLGGLDTFYFISSYLFASLSDMKVPSITLKNLMETKQLGVKTGNGFYNYSNGKDEESIRRRDNMFFKMLKHIHSSEKVR